MIFILVQVPIDILLFLCICLMITAQNLITVQVIQMYLCELAPVVVLGHNNHCGTETHTWYNCLIPSALSFNPLTIKNKSYITVKNGFCNLSGYKVFITYPNGSLDETLM